VVLSGLSAFASTSIRKKLRLSEEYPDISLRQRVRAAGTYGSGNDTLVNVPKSVLLRKGHRIRVALAGAEASLFERYPATRNTQVDGIIARRSWASYLDSACEDHDP